MPSEEAREGIEILQHHFGGVDRREEGNKQTTGRFFPLNSRCGGAYFGRSGISQNKTCTAAPRTQREKSPGRHIGRLAGS